MAALVCAWGLPAVCRQPLGQLRRCLSHRPRHAGLTPSRTAPFGPPSRSLVAAAAGPVAGKTAEEVKKEIVEYYDKCCAVWEMLCGHHVHVGYYDAGATPTPADTLAAMIRLVEEALRFAGVSDDTLQRPRNIVDVGCGVGGSTVYLAKRFGAKCEGINLSPVQIERARLHAAAEGCADKVTFHLADAMEQPFPDGQFDLVWCMESIEHMPDKRKFLSELARVAAPGGTIVITGMCQRDLSSDKDSLGPDEESLLKTLCDAYNVASWFSVADYIKIIESLSLQDIKTANWTENIVPFWPSVMQSAMTLEGSRLLLESGWEVVKSVLMAPMLIECYKRKVINYAIITCRKPQ